MKYILESRQLSIGTLTEKLRLVVLKEAQFGYRRWSYVQKLLPISDQKILLEQSNHRKTFNWTISSRMKLIQWEVDWWKWAVSSEEGFGFFIIWVQRVLHTDKLVNSDTGGMSPVCNFAHKCFRSLKTGKRKCKIGFNFSPNRNLEESSKS